VQFQYFRERLGCTHLEQAFAGGTAQLNQGQQRQAEIRRVKLRAVPDDHARILELTGALGDRRGR